MMKQGKNFKIQSDAFIARREAKKLKNKLRVKKIQRKKNNGVNSGSSLRIKTDINYSKKRILVEASLLPGLEKVVTLLTKKDQDASLGYQTDKTSNISVHSGDNGSNSNQSRQLQQQQQEEENQQQQQKQKQQKWLDESIENIIEGKKDAISIFKELQTMKEKIYAAKCWQFFESAQKIHQQLALSATAEQRQQQEQANQQYQEMELLFEEESKEVKKKDLTNTISAVFDKQTQYKNNNNNNNYYYSKSLQSQHDCKDKRIILKSKRIQKKTKQSIKKHKQRIKEGYDKKQPNRQELFLAKQQEMLDTCNQSKQQNQQQQQINKLKID